MSTTTRKSLLRKRASRMAASQALYATALKDDKTAPAQMVAQIVQSWADSKTFDAHDLPHDIQPEQALLTRIVTEALEQSEAIEAAIEEVILPNWKKSRMSLPLLSTLRAAAAEYLAFPGKSRGMLVEEYTEIASQLVGDEEVAYAHKAFNLLLDALAPGEKAHG
jgi:transcription termination factor NusB